MKDKPLNPVRILKTCHDWVNYDPAMDDLVRIQMLVFLERAIKHISKPDRDIYPKMRGQAKTQRKGTRWQKTKSKKPYQYQHPLLRDLS